MVGPPGVGHGQDGHGGEETGGVIEGYGVRLTPRAKRDAAVSLCHRVKQMLAEMEEQRRPAREERVKSGGWCEGTRRHGIREYGGRTC
jgi:hypothetical protein